MWRDSRLQLLLAIGSLTVMAGAVLAPNLPELIHQLHFEPGIAGTLVSLHFLTVAISLPLLGILADSVGALPVLVPSLILYAGFGMAGAAMDSLVPLMITRVLLGVATGGLTAASLGLVGKLYRADARSQVLAYVASTISLANIVYPLLGGWVGSFHWQWAFYLYGVGLPLAALSLLLLRDGAADQEVAGAASPPGSEIAGELLPDVAIAPLRSNLFLLLRHPHTVGLLLALGLTSGTVYTSIVYVPLYLRTALGTSTLVIGIILASKALGATVISAVGVRPLVKAWGNLGAIALGYGVMAAALITIPHLQQISLILPTALLFGMGFGIVVPSLYGLLADQAPMQLQSSILAAGTGAGFLGQFLFPILFAPVFGQVGITGVFYTAAIVALGAGSLIVVRLSQQRANPLHSKR